MLINTSADLHSVEVGPEHLAFLQSLLNDYVTYDDAEYPDGHNRSLLPGDDGFIEPVIRREWNAAAAASWGFTSRKQIETALRQ